MLPAGQRLFASVPEILGAIGPDDQVLVDPVAALLPGLGEHLPQMEVLATDSVRLALEKHQGQLVQREQALSFVTSLPMLGSNVASAVHKPAPVAEPEPAVAVPDPAPIPTPTPTPAPAPTHLLVDDRAQPLATDGTALQHGCELYLGDGGWQLRGDTSAAQLNGSPYRAGQLLQCGDSIQIDNGSEARLIEVTP